MGFSPRRLTHVNLFIEDLERSMQFYNQIAGLEDVRREPGISAGFLTNGNTHHDIGVSETTKDQRVGLGGHVQVAAGRASVVGLNHLGWEMETEDSVVQAYHALMKQGVDIHRRADHKISHSIYVFDPEGNYNEFYADALDDWRTLFNPSREELVTEEWGVDEMQRGTDARRYNPAPEIRHVEGAVFHPIRMSYAVLVARDLQKMTDFYVNVGGLKAHPVSAPVGVNLLSGTLGKPDLALVAAADGMKPGLHHFAFEIPAETRFSDVKQVLKGKGYSVEAEIDDARKASLFVRDPDGCLSEFCARRSPFGALAADIAPKLVPYHV